MSSWSRIQPAQLRPGERQAELNRRHLEKGTSYTGREEANILVIWGDDIGQSDVRCYTKVVMGYRTPNIDRIER